MGIISDNIKSLKSEHGLKNYIINGNFDVWQYGTSQTSSGYGSDDRWSNGSTGSTKTHSRVACTDTEKALFNASYFSRTTVSSVVGTLNYCSKAQLIENVTKLANKTITISFWAKADSNKNIAVELAQNFGTGGSPSAVVSGIASQLISLTTTWQKKTIVVTVPSIVGKTLGTDGVNTTYLGINFWFDAGSTFNTRTSSLGQQSGTFDIAQVQIEEGSVATPFEQRPYDLERIMCGAPDATKVLGFNGGIDLGVGQTWQDVTASRVAGTTYTNSTGKPIMVTVYQTTAAGTSDVSLTVNGIVIQVSRASITGSTNRLSICGIVPNGSTYVVNSGYALTWSELR